MSATLDPELRDVVDDDVVSKPLTHLDRGTPGFSERFARETRRAKLDAIRELVDAGELTIRKLTDDDLARLDAARARRHETSPQTRWFE